MLSIEVFTRADLSRVLERATVDKKPGMTIEDALRAQLPAYTPEAAARAYVSLYADGVKIPQDLWAGYLVRDTRQLRIVIEAGGITAGVIIAIISVVLAVASAVYGIIMANRLGKAGPTDTKQGSSIYDVNAQGNQVNLTNVVPENFGHFKRFPDYLADRHVFYRNNTQFVDMILCQGCGSYEHAADHSDVYVGETPINELPGCSIYVIEPGEEMTAENTPGDRSWYCFYSSTEVTSSGHALEPAVTEIDQSSQNEASATFTGDTFAGGYYTYGGGVNWGCAGPTGGAVRIYKPLDLHWSAGSYFALSGSISVRQIGTADDVTDNQDGTSTITAALAAYFNNANQALHRAWLRARETDPDTGTITAAGDAVNITITAITAVTYTTMSGTGGPVISTDEASYTITSQAELLGVSYSGDDADLTFDTLELELPPYPAAPAVPPGAQNVTTAQRLEISINQPIPADYTWGNDNGLYEILEITDHTYKVRKVTSSYDPVPGWVEFWAQGTTQTGLSFTLDENSQSGAYVGPYRACPYGAESNIFEYDIRFPGGLGYLQDDGTFRDLTVEIEIGYRAAGSSDAWTTVTRSFTDHTNDELAFTFQLETEQPGNLEFRMRNLSESSNSTRALEEVRWVGLKSVISTRNSYAGMTTMIGRFKGSETLSELSANQVATYWTRKLPDIESGDLTATRALAPAVKYVVNTSKYAGIIDQESLLEYNDIWEAQGIKLDGTIDGDGTLLQVLRDILSVGFAAPVIDNNKLAFTRLHLRGENEPLAQIFTPQNLTGSPQITFNLPREEDTDEVVVEYTDPATYKTAMIYCHTDENGDAEITEYPQSVHQERLKAFGVTERRQAEAMGMRRLRYLRSTRVTYKIQTEMDGLNCQYNDLVGLVLDEELSNITGRITAHGLTLDAITTDMEIPEELSTGVIYIRKKDGTSMSTTYTRQDSHHLTLADPLPEWDPRFGEDLELPFFAIGNMVTCWVTAVEPQDKRVTLTLTNYAPEVFTDDL